MGGWRTDVERSVLCQPIPGAVAAPLVAPSPRRSGRWGSDGHGAMPVRGHAARSPQGRLGGARQWMGREVMVEGALCFGQRQRLAGVLVWAPLRGEGARVARGGSAPSSPPADAQPNRSRCPTNRTGPQRARRVPRVTVGAAEGLTPGADPAPQMTPSAPSPMLPMPGPLPGVDRGTTGVGTTGPRIGGG